MKQGQLEGCSCHPEVVCNPGHLQWPNPVQQGRYLHAKVVAYSQKKVMVHNQQVVAHSQKEVAVCNWKVGVCSWEEVACNWKGWGLVHGVASMQWAVVVQVS